MITGRLRVASQRFRSRSCYHFQCLDDLKITRWAINVLPALPIFAFGNVAILGDAVSPLLYRIRRHQNMINNQMQAHAMTPFQGAGAGQAIEVSLHMISFSSVKTYDVGCLNPGCAAFK